MPRSRWALGCGRRLDTLLYICPGHEGIVWAPEPVALALLLADETPCPVCGSDAAYAVFCRPCRLGDHDRCVAFRVGAGRALAGRWPRRAEEYCACTCDPAGALIPGLGGARGYPDGGEP